MLICKRPCRMRLPCLVAAHAHAAAEAVAGRAQQDLTAEMSKLMEFKQEPDCILYGFSRFADVIHCMEAYQGGEAVVNHLNRVDGPLKKVRTAPMPPSPAPPHMWPLPSSPGAIRAPTCRIHRPIPASCQACAPSSSCGPSVRLYTHPLTLEGRIMRAMVGRHTHPPIVLERLMRLARRPSR